MILRRVQYEAARRVVGPVLASLDAWQRRLRRRRGRPRAGPFGPPLQSTRKLKELMAVHYYQGRFADGAVPVAWVTSGFPVEVLRPLGFHAVYPENHAAICGVQRLVPALSDAAEAEGFSRDLCSYARTDLGSVIAGRTPVGRLPRPDLLACCTNICQTVLYWYRALAERLGVPLVLVDTPYVYGREAKPHLLRYVRDQLEELVRVAERVSGRRTEPEALAEAARLAKVGTDLWGECLALGRHRPAPWTAIDGFFHMAPIVSLRGSEACNAYYRLLRDELADRVRRGVGGIRDERHRLLWDNLPIWFAVRELSTLFAERGFNFVCTSYTNAWAEAGSRIDPADPLGSAASAYTHVILNQDLPNRLGILRRLARDYAADGAVLHSDRSCKPYSIGQVDLKERLAAELGIRVLLLEADHSDPRAWAAEQGENRLTAFMEGFA
ncbi:MAG TPA: 2-hydroxyacyl-CoA dehydratase family protein [Anaeromyxobacteraceae bacterium]|nr:2-hydroxyacyl-CoA dehydratase family protein [Anaeromyxobacteraceae bacterium]